MELRCALPQEGKLQIAGVRGGYGLLVEIDHGYGYRTRYGHNSRLAVREANG